MPVFLVDPVFGYLPKVAEPQVGLRHWPDGPAQKPVASWQTLAADLKPPDLDHAPLRFPLFGRHNAKRRASGPITIWLSAGPCAAVSIGGSLVDAAGWDGQANQQIMTPK